MDVHEELRVREFELLRAEILSHQHLENNWALFAATGTGALLALSIERGEGLLCLAAPFIVLASAFRVGAIRSYVWRIAAYLMLQFDERDRLAGSAWERRLVDLRVFRRRAGRRSPSADSWLLLFGLLLVGGCLASILVWLRGLLTAGWAIVWSDPNFLASPLTILLSLCVWFLSVRKRFAKGVGDSQQEAYVSDWKVVLAGSSVDGPAGRT